MGFVLGISDFRARQNWLSARFGLGWFRASGAWSGCGQSVRVGDGFGFQSVAGAGGRELVAEKNGIFPFFIVVAAKKELA